MRVVADGGATACLNRCVLAALFAPSAQARLLYEATTAVSAVRASIVPGDLQQCVSGLLKCADQNARISG